MSFLYPNELRIWIEKSDYTTVVFADHFNTAQDELNALYRTVGLTPQIARNDPGSTPSSMWSIVDWISNAPADDLDDILDLIENSRDKSHEELMAECLDLWPDWGGRN